MPEENASSGESEWGEDWEAAFQAEDDLFLPDLDDDAPTTDSGENADGSEGEDSGPPPPANPPEPSRQTENGEQVASLPAALIWIMAGAGIGLVLTLVAIGIYLMLTDAPEAPPTAKQPAASAQAPPAKPPAPGGQAQLPPKRIKISLRPFLVPVMHPSGKPLKELVNMKITLVAGPGGGKASADGISPRQRISIRASVYRLFSTTPSRLLHRYTLARGEMVRKTITAIRRSVPDLTIKSLMFDHYQILAAG